MHVSLRIYLFFIEPLRKPYSLLYGRAVFLNAFGRMHVCSISQLCLVQELLTLMEAFVFLVG